MKPYYGALNTEGQWWDGQNWKNYSEIDKITGKRVPGIVEFLTFIETLREHNDFNCHVDGVFKCPRCRRKHFIPDHFEFLCDGCVTLVLAHPLAPEGALINIPIWQEKARKHRLGELDSDIVSRCIERDRLWAEATAVTLVL